MDITLLEHLLYSILERQNSGGEWENQKLFEQIVFYIQQYGNKERFKHKYYTQLYLGEYKYWTMGYPINQTILINRKPKNIL